MPLKPEADPQAPHRKWIIESFEKMKKRDWRKDGKPKWWVRLGRGFAFKFIEIPQIPGCKKLLTTIDLDTAFVPAGETLYFGVGTDGIGVRDEYYIPLDKTRLIWYIHPRKDLDQLGNFYYLWITTCGRYRISRSPIFGDFTAYFQKSVLSRHTSLNEALLAVDSHNMLQIGDPSIITNIDAVMEWAIWKKIHEVVEPLKEKYRASVIDGAMTPQCPECNRSGGWSEKCFFCVYCGRVKKVKQKDYPKAVTKKKGVVSAIIDILRARTKGDPITKEGILAEMMILFDDRTEEQLRRTINSRLVDMKKRRGVDLRHNKNGYWILG